MQTPLQISFRGMEASEAVEARIRERVERLERISERLTSCHVVVQEPHRHHHKGKLFDIRIHVHIPGEEYVVTREGSQNHAYEDVYVALRDAFSAMERRLENLNDRRQERAPANGARRATEA